MDTIKGCWNQIANVLSLKDAGSYAVTTCTVVVSYIGPIFVTIVGGAVLVIQYRRVRVKLKQDKIRLKREELKLKHECEEGE